ncbi:MAG TPA: hypothetical protein PK339_07485 [Flavitalea sp.]|nr:hypothetical protein [Flavitalea sp.]
MYSGILIHKKPAWYLFAGFTALLLLHVAFLFCGFYGNDDINYARHAGELLNTGVLSFTDTDHFRLRWTCIFFTALCYKILGVTAFASSLFSFFSFALTAWLIYLLLRKEPVRLLLFAYAMFFLSFTVIFYAHRLLPDSGVCLFVFAAYFYYHRKRFSEAPDWISAACFALSLFLAMITKETIIITAPLWIWLLVSDIAAKRNRRFWTMAICFLAALTGLYLLYFELSQGDWLFRYDVINNYSELDFDGIAYQQLGSLALAKRLGYELWQAFLFNGDFEYLIFAVGAFVYRRKIFTDAASRHIAMSFMILLLSANFMSYSVNGYNPLWPDPRHFIFIVPFAVVSGAYMLNAYLKEPSKYILVLVLFLLADAWLFLSEIGNTKYVYLLITLVLGLRLLNHYFPAKTLSVNWLIGGWIAAMSLNYINDIVKPRYPFYFDQQAVVKQYFSDLPGEAIVYSGDALTAEMSDFFLEFKNERIRFVNIHELEHFNAGIDNQYLLINGGYNPYFKQKADSLLAGDSRSGVEPLQTAHTVVLYQLRDTAILHPLKNFSTNKL